MDDMLKLILPIIISGLVFLVQLYIAGKIAPLDKKLSVICGAVADLKHDNEKQWTEIAKVKSEFDTLHGQHQVNHK